METKDILLQLRTQDGFSRGELAEKVFVTRQAVSRWETGETTSNTETPELVLYKKDKLGHKKAAEEGEPTSKS